MSKSEKPLLTDTSIIQLALQLQVVKLLPGVALDSWLFVSRVPPWWCDPLLP